MRMRVMMVNLRWSWGWDGGGGQIGCIYRRLYLMVRPTIDPSNNQ